VAVSGSWWASSKMMVLAEGLAHARGGADWAKVVTVVEKAARDLRLTFPQDVVRMSLAQIAPSSDFFSALATVKEMLAAMIDVLEDQAARAETIEQLRVRAVELAAALDGWKAGRSADAGKGKPAEGDDAVLWVEAFSSSLQLHRTPLSIAPIFNNQREGTPRSWIFTSATLAVKNDFKHFSDQMGLGGEPAKTWPSPFDYAQQGLLYVPTGLPDPNAMGYTDAVVDCALPVIEAAGGRTFFLCTTIRAVKHVAERLRKEFSDRGLEYPLFVQGERGRTELLDSFRTAGNAVLVGSQSFWEGVDVRGDALSLVIIDKLPFAPPDDPVLAARIDVMEKQGKNGFMHHTLPEAIINLKQGAGRLIRDETDRGVLMICDPRLISKSYGKRVWQSLPPFKRTRLQADVIAFFKPEPPTAP
jgi:ATP-dependent DNA helicase DinG